MILPKTSKKRNKNSSVTKLNISVFVWTLIPDFLLAVFLMLAVLLKRELGF